MVAAYVCMDDSQHNAPLEYPSPDIISYRVDCKVYISSSDSSSDTENAWQIIRLILPKLRLSCLRNSRGRRLHHPDLPFGLSETFLFQGSISCSRGGSVESRGDDPHLSDPLRTRGTLQDDPAASQESRESRYLRIELVGRPSRAFHGEDLDKNLQKTHQNILEPSLSLKEEYRLSHRCLDFVRFEAIPIHRKSN